MKPLLKMPGTKSLKHKCDEPLSSLAFKFNLCYYILVLPRFICFCDKHWTPILPQCAMVRRCKLKPVFTSTE